MKRLHAVQLTRLLSVAVCGWLTVSSRAVAEESRPSAETTPSTSVNAAAKAVLREAFTYNPAVRKKAEAEAAKKVADGAVQMDAVVVAEDKNRNPSFENFMARQRQLKEVKKPSLERGAEIPGLPGVGVTPYVDAIPFGPPTPRWSLIKILF